MAGIRFDRDVPDSFGVARGQVFQYLEGMDVRLNNPDIQAKIDQWVAETGRGPDELIEDAMAGYFEELSRTQEMLNSRYDDLNSGRVNPIPGDEVIARLCEKSEARRSQSGSSHAK
ncbi:MAG: hypothetical protein LAO30_17600 [Acidobacteriia bacterium]|nr:hypothetical protein [Terriglobia bacterium]